MRTAVWLRPEAKVSAWLDEAIADIARDVGHTVFGAHLTVASGPGSIGDQDLRDWAAAFAPIILTPSGLMQTEVFTRTFAVTFERAPALDHLRDKASPIVGDRDELPFLPHVSLIYGKADATKRLEALAARFDGPIRFDRIAVVTAGERCVSQADVAAWQVGPDYSLRG